jgi:hypothetical protein
MGGCYSGSYYYSDKGSNAGSSCSRDTSYQSHKRYFKKFLEKQDNEDLVLAYKAYMDENKSGFFAEFAKVAGVNDVKDIPKEFPDIEYEVKFDIQVEGKEKEPEVVEYLNAFDFPATKTARFLKDPTNTFAVGINHFYGDFSDERLVVIEKGNGIFLKEKGLVMQLNVPVKYKEVVIKRTEKRWQSSLEEAIEKVSKVCNEDGVLYRGKVRKEKGDAFVLDSNDGRIYSFTITRAHLVKPGEKKETGIQRQLEIEYAGYIPGFNNFEKNSEKQIVAGMVDLAKFVYALYSEAPLAKNWRMRLDVTGERKYDFIAGKDKDRVKESVQFVPQLIASQVSSGSNGKNTLLLKAR